MRSMVPFILLLLLCAVTSPAQSPSDTLDYPAIAQIRDEGLNRSQAMDTLFWLSDR